MQTGPDQAGSVRLGRRRAIGVAAGLAAAGLTFGYRPVFAAPKAADLYFSAVGDWGREGHDEQRAVGAAMAREAAVRQAAAKPNAWVLSLGDNFYEDGVTGVDDPQWQLSFERIYDAASLQTPWLSILGNHDYRGSVQAQLDYGAARDTRWRMPNRYYSRRERLADGCLCDFFFLDTNPFISRYRNSRVNIGGQDPAAQLAWLERGLAASDADWKIVVGHHPVHTADGGNSEEPELIAALRPLLERHRVRIYLNGHIHNLQHVRIGPVDYITNGAASKLLALNPVRRGWALRQHGFMTTSLSRDRFAFAFFGSDGSLLYQAALGRQI